MVGYQRVFHYNVTPQEFSHRLAAQRGLCASCGIKAATHLDHDHITGQIRDILCNSCNQGLGHFQDNPDLLIKAAQYLKKHQENSHF